RNQRGRQAPAPARRSTGREPGVPGDSEEARDPVREGLRAIPPEPERPSIDRARVERAVREILLAIGEDPDRDGLVRTPARLADTFARRPQVQERLTTQIADTIDKVLSPKGVLVVIEAEHLCMSMRGVRKPGSLTVTSAVRGLFKTNAATRAEAMGFIHR